MNCPRCQSEDIERVARRNVWEDLKRHLGRWPYECGACGCRFSGSRRYPPPPRAPLAPPSSSPAPHAASPEMAFRRHHVRPTAQVVIQADDHVQLDKILMALNKAILSYQPAPQPAPAARERTKA